MDRLKFLRRSTAVGVAVVLLFFGSAATAKDRVEVRFDESFDFTGVRTYDFFLHPSKLQDGAIAELLRPRLRSYVEELLRAKGFERSSDNPDFEVIFDGQISDSLDIWGGYRAVVTKNMVIETYVPYGGQRSRARGMLIIRMRLPGEEDAFWGGGTITDFPDYMKTEKIIKKVEKAARNILADFPPR